MPGDLRAEVEALHADIKRRLADDDTLGPVNRRDLGEVLDRLRSMLDVRRAPSSPEPESAGMDGHPKNCRCHYCYEARRAPAPRPEETRTATTPNACPGCGKAWPFYSDRDRDGRFCIACGQYEWASSQREDGGGREP